MIVEKKLLKNTFYGGLVQGGNFIFPLLTLPYLVRVLGVENYGEYIFATTFAAFLGVICDYGFGLTGVRDISAEKNLNKIGAICSSALVVKFILLTLSILIFFISYKFTLYFEGNFYLYFYSITAAVAQSFVPTWIFQGLEDFKTTVILNFISKLIGTALIFLLVINDYDGYKVSFSNTLGSIFSVVLGYFLLFKKHRVILRMPPVFDISKHFKSGFYVFVSQFKILLFSASNIIILRFLCGDLAVGMYSAAEKIMRAVALIQVPLLSALFPRISSQLKSDYQSSILFLRKLLIFGVLFYSVLILIIFIFAEDVISLFYASNLRESVVVLKIIIICPLLIYTNNIFGTQILLNLGKDKYYLLVLSVAGFLNLLVCTALTKSYGLIGTSVALLLSEIFVAFGFFCLAKKYIILYSKNNLALK